MSFKNAMGGTELMHNQLMSVLPQELKDKFSIFNYPVNAEEGKKLIFWNQLSYDQPAVEILKDEEFINQIDLFVFVSHWQAEKFRQTFGIPAYKTAVIKNACLGVEQRDFGSRDKVRICYTSTPFRGLDVLLGAWELLKPQNAELHVFSSCQIYGEEFGQNDVHYQELYDKCNELEGVTYRGSIPNDELRKELPTFDILAYPSTFEETSCIAVIEAISAGLKVICSSLGALPETTEGWATIYPYYPNKEFHAIKFAELLEKEIKLVENGFDHTNQVEIYKERWSWETREKEWIELLSKMESI